MRWLRVSRGLDLSKHYYSKDFIESFFKWVSYNAANALVLKVMVPLQAEHKWGQLVAVFAVSIVFTNLTLAYGVAEIALPFAKRTRDDLVAPIPRWWVIALVMLALQITFWIVFDAFGAAMP